MAENRRRVGISRRDFLRTAVAGGGALAVGPIFWRRPGWAAVPPAGIHLAYGADPRSEMTISWLTTEPVSSPVLSFGPDPDNHGDPIAAETRSVEVTEPVYDSVPIYSGSPSRYHHVRLTGLDSGTTYSYRVSHSGGPSSDSSFRTAPDGAEPFRFTAFGDQGVSAAAAGMTGVVSALEPAFHFHVGDLCYAHTVIGLGMVGPTDQAVWDRWFAQISPVAAARPWMPTVGNHEMEPGYGELGYGGYLSRFTLPAGGPLGAPTVYAFCYGNVALIALDANDASYEIPKNRCYLGSTQDEWLRATLESLRAEPAIDFIVVGFHHCAYCTNFLHGSDGGVRDRWGALFDEFNVDLVINGHNHCYERTHPVRNGAKTRDVADGGIVDPVADGTTYVTAGGGGSTIYPLSLAPASYVSVVGGLRIPELADWSATRALELSLLAADVVPPASANGETTMTLTAYRADASVVEQVTLRRKQGERFAASGTETGGATPLAPLGSCDLPGAELP